MDSRMTWRRWRAALRIRPPDPPGSRSSLAHPRRLTVLAITLLRFTPLAISSRQVTLWELIETSNYPGVRGDGFNVRWRRRGHGAASRSEPDRNGRVCRPGDVHGRASG